MSMMRQPLHLIQQVVGCNSSKDERGLKIPKLFSGFRGWIALLATSLGLVSVGLAQAAKESISVELPIVTAAPGAEVAVPLVLKMTKAQAVGRILAEVELPTDFLELQAVQVGSAAEQGKAIVAHTLGAEKEGRRIVTIEIKSGSGASLSPGELARLIIRIREGVPEQTVSLTNVSQAWSAGPSPVQLEDVKSLKGIITVSSEGPALFACFFYMH